MITREVVRPPKAEGNYTMCWKSARMVLVSRNLRNHVEENFYSVSIIKKSSNVLNLLIQEYYTFHNIAHILPYL